MSQRTRLEVVGKVAKLVVLVIGNRGGRGFLRGEQVVQLLLLRVPCGWRPCWATTA